MSGEAMSASIELLKNQYIHIYMICDIGTVRQRESNCGAESTQCGLPERYMYRKDTGIQKIQRYEDTEYTEDTKTAAIATFPLPFPLIVSKGGEGRFACVR